MNYDVLVVGSGPAGLAAAVAARGRDKSVLVVGNPWQESPLARAERIDNYLGLPGVNGRELMEHFSAHAQRVGVEFHTGRVVAVMAWEGFALTAGSEVFQGRTLVLAPGVARLAKYPGEAELLGRGVSYCATCDGMLYREKDVAVLGYSDSARQEAEFLERIGCHVTYFDRPRTCEIQGSDRVRSVTCDGKTAKVACVFILRPTLAPTDLFPGLAVEKGYVAVDRRMATNLPGLFAAGDCTGGPLQAVKAAGEGLIAGQSAAAYVSDLERQARKG